MKALSHSRRSRSFVAKREAGASQQRAFLPQAFHTSHYHMLATAHATDAFELTINRAGTLHELLLHLYMHSPYRPYYHVASDQERSDLMDS